MAKLSEPGYRLDSLHHGVEISWRGFGSSRLRTLPSDAVAGFEELPPHGLNDDAQVEREGPILDVFQIQIDASLGQLDIHCAAAETPRLRKAC